MVKGMACICNVLTWARDTSVFSSQGPLCASISGSPSMFPHQCRWVPKLARKYVKPEDICFSDVTQYDPRLLEQAPYRLPITSTVPLLADKVLPCHHACTSMTSRCEIW